MSALRRIWFGATKRAAFVWGYAKAALLLRLVAERTGGAPLFVGRAPKLVVRGRLRVGRDFRMRSSVLRSLIEVGPSGSLEIGDHVFINQGAVIAAEQRILIGDRVDIGDAVRIYDSNFHPVKPGGRTKTAPVILEDDVWIASGVTILPGVRIGRGSVVGAGSVVIESVPSGAIASGNPASVVSRFDVPDDFRRRGPGAAHVGPASADITASPR